mgnify:CR=1 FL=1
MARALHSDDAVPDDVARMISDRYRSLPHPSVRWRTVAGRDFQHMLEKFEYVYGRPPIAAITPLTRQGIRAIVDRRPVKDNDVIPYPTSDELRALSQAWDLHLAVNRLGRSVRRGSLEFRAVERALDPLRQCYDLRIISLATKIPIGRLRKFQGDS